MKTINVGVIGFGTVGTGVVRTLLEKRHLLERRVGTSVRLKAVADRNLRRSRGVRVDRKLLHHDAQEILRDPSIDIVVELVGGIHPAKEFILEAFRRGKHVVTANKALLATHGNEIFAAARKH
ncbi:MAG: Gfo/Idh/MocA family oxidoreductase, partial [Candidatus Omnitrophica bacterium]|nr:Gfo/Idh/MocA family oxidoreductase [Candidatus Omnitrophota bacterium]